MNANRVEWLWIVMVAASANALAQFPQPRIKVGQEERPFRVLEIAPGSYVALTLSCAGSSCSITVNGSQSAVPNTVDFSSAEHTIIAKKGTEPPSTCTVGEWFFDTDATPGNNIMLCTSTNTWTPVTGSGGSGAGYAYTWVGAQCHGSTAGTSFAFDTLTPPGAVCIGGNNVNRGVLRFYGLSATSAWQTIVLPSSFSSVTLYGDWETSGTSGNVVWQVKTACAPVGSSSDPSWNAPQTVTIQAPSTARTRSRFTISPVSTTGCYGGDAMFLMISRDPNHPNDTLVEDADLITLYLEIR